jgi:uncharacterized protein GlcG (DUF336 family)
VGGPGWGSQERCCEPQQPGSGCRCRASSGVCYREAPSRFSTASDATWIFRSKRRVASRTQTWRRSASWSSSRSPWPCSTREAVSKSFAAQDGTSLLRGEVAHGKAYGAPALGLGSRALFARAQQQAYFIGAVNTLARGALVPVPGGVLIRDRDGRLLGAVGVSGDISDNDEACAVAGIEAAGLTAETG